MWVHVDWPGKSLKEWLDSDDESTTGNTEIELSPGEVKELISDLAAALEALDK